MQLTGIGAFKILAVYMAVYLGANRFKTHIPWPWETALANINISNLRIQLRVTKFESHTTCICF